MSRASKAPQKKLPETNLDLEEAYYTFKVLCLSYINAKAGMSCLEKSLQF